MKRFKMFFRFDREEKWLEEMAGNGWLLCGKGVYYPGGLSGVQAEGGLLGVCGAV